LYLKTPPFYNPACRYSNPHSHLPEAQQQYLQQQQSLNNTNNSFSYTNYTGYRSYNAPINARPSEQELLRQGQKDIESLLSSIPSDVPIVNKIKRKKKKTQRKIHHNKKVIIGSDDEEDDVFQRPVISAIPNNSGDEQEEDGDENENEDEDDDDGYVIEGLAINLMDHQIKGVSWMVDRENNKSSNGGILADDMGLGKTIQTIGLILSSMDTDQEEAEEKVKEVQEPAEKDDDEHQMTLIVTPLALIHQWVDEIKNKTEYGKLNVLKHHGPNRTKNPAVFKRYDVVVTTYQVVSSDSPSDKKKKPNNKKSITLDGFIVQDEEDNDDDGYDRHIPSKWQQLKKGYGPLFQVNWHRIVLDEAQQIKNRQTKSSISCSELSSVKRWCLTGTPIQNNVDELYSLLRFLKIQPLSDYPTFKKNISIPIQNGQGSIAMERLKAVLRAVMLRRTKDVLRSNQTSPITSNTASPMPSASNNEEDESLSKKLTLQLPTREKQDIMLQFSDHEKSLYELLRTRTRESIQAMGGQSGGYMNMLCLLLRLRQGKIMRFTKNISCILKFTDIFF
jgi:SNF2 family DNA or RNA helicase